jgi:hypothetical protein
MSIRKEQEIRLRKEVRDIVTSHISMELLTKIA